MKAKQTEQLIVNLTDLELLEKIKNALSRNTWFGFSNLRIEPKSGGTYTLYATCSNTTREWLNGFANGIYYFQEENK